MSGGHWDYFQYRLEEVVDDLKMAINNNGKKITAEEAEWLCPLEKEDSFHREFSKETLEGFRKVIETVSKAHLYINSVDRLMSGDDGEDDFIGVVNNDSPIK